MARFTTGFIYFFILFLLRKKSFKPNNFKIVLMRAVTNSIAVMMMFISFNYTTATNGNMLCSTSPVFIFLILPFFGNEKVKKEFLIYLLMMVIGMYFVALPKFDYINKGDLIAILSAVVAAFAVTALKQARKYDNTEIIILYLMGIGSLLNLIFLMPSIINGTIVMPIDFKSWFILLLSAAFSVLGQVILTISFKYVNASLGSVLSASSIVFVPILEIFLLGQSITRNVVLGGILITFAVLLVTLREQFIVEVRK